jgi:hypothetical protein
MVEKGSVVTGARFASGLSYEAYVAQIKVNQDRFKEFYEGCQISSQDREFFIKAGKLAHGPAKLMVLGEDWCPDVFRGLPMMARIAEAGGMELRVFPRDLNLDIMNEFLKDGKYMSLPVGVFYTRDLQYLCHWIERPKMADLERAKFEQEARRANPNATEQEMRALVGGRSRERYPAWQQESVREIRSLLATKLGIKLVDPQ